MTEIKVTMEKVELPVAVINQRGAGGARLLVGKATDTMIEQLNSITWPKNVERFEVQVQAVAVYQEVGA